MSDGGMIPPVVVPSIDNIGTNEEQTVVGYVRINREMLVRAAAHLRALSDELTALAGSEAEREAEPDPESERVGPGDVSPDVLFLARAIEGEGVALLARSATKWGCGSGIRR